jgi:steroid delta-isomerase-like uncharacterized protein
MSAEANEAASRRVFDIFNGEDLDGFDEILSADFVNYDPAEPEGAIRGIEAAKERTQGYRTAMSDLNVTVEEVIATDDAVVARWRAKGTNDGELMGIPATGKSMEITGMTIDHFDPEGRIVESFDQWDNAGFMQQLGISPDVLAEAS